MHLLAQFLFSGNRIHLPVAALSGGERLRATLACVLYAEPAPQLLLLDEPTNNLDLVSVGQLEAALNAYEGAFVVVSHDERFLDEIGIQRRLRLSAGPVGVGEFALIGHAIGEPTAIASTVNLYAMAIRPDSSPYGSQTVTGPGWPNVDEEMLGGRGRDV